MSIKQVIKVPSSAQNCVGSLLGCYQDNSCIVNLQNSVHCKKSEQTSTAKEKKTMLKRTRFWQNDSIYGIIHQILVQNINSLNSISKAEVHDYSQVECE